MSDRIAPAAVPAEAWTHLRRLPEIEVERAALAGAHPAGGRSDRAGFRRVRMRELTTEALQRAVRLRALGIDPRHLAVLPVAPAYSEREA